MVPGSVFEEHIDDLSLFVTNTSRIQLSHDAALIGKAVKDCKTKMGLTLSCKPELLANDQSLRKLIESVPNLSRGSSDRPGDRNCSKEEEMCGKAMEAHLESQTKGQESQPSVQDEPGGAKTHNDWRPHCSNLWTHCTGASSTAQVNAMRKNFKMETVMGKTQTCAVSTVACFRRVHMFKPHFTCAFVFICEVFFSCVHPDRC